MNNGANFNYTKSFGTAMYPVHALKTSGLLQRAEPFLTPEQLLSRFLKGIPLVFPNGDRFSMDDLKDRIYLAQNTAELELKTTITRELRQDKLAFKQEDYKAYIHLNAEQKPVCTIHQLAIVSADKNNIFEIPPEWIETSNFSKGIINVIPLLAAYGVNSVQGAVGNAGIAFLTVIDGLNWVPAYWQIKYTSGLSNTEGLVPTLVNELVGTIAAIDILSEIAATFIHNSQSQTQDGISQSSSGPGPRIYIIRIEDLMRKREMLEKKLKGIFSNKFYVGNF
ncbi:MAG TPA: hypothetical protein VN855_00355 [Candidatus Acidoferrum sp.]|nr:hypothetical protein [Candidatus Acidoferrum sp.]